MSKPEFEKLRIACIQKMKFMDATIKGVEETQEYKEMNAYNQAIRDVLELMKEFENNVSETTEQVKVIPVEEVSGMVDGIKAELIRLFSIRKKSWEDEYFENKEIALAHVKSWDSAIRIIEGNAMDDVVNEKLFDKQ